MMSDLGQRAVACKGWRWMPGMLARGYVPMPAFGGAVALRVVGDSEAWGGPIGAPAGWLPDLTDPATLGCLLALVREAWGDSDVCVEVTSGYDAIPGEWFVVGRYGVILRNCATEAEALVCALEAAP